MRRPVSSDAIVAWTRPVRPRDNLEPLLPTALLLRLAPPLRNAFPARAEAMLAAVDRWLHPAADDEPACDLCGGALGAPFAGAYREGAHFEIDRGFRGGTEPALCWCSRCVERRDDDEVTQPARLLADVSRAMRESGDAEADDCLAAIAAAAAALPVLYRASAACDACGEPGPCLVGATRGCHRCLDRAREILARPDEIGIQGWENFAQALERSPPGDIVASWQRVCRRATPPPFVAEAWAVRITGDLEQVAQAAQNALVVESDPLLPFAATLLLRAHTPSDGLQARITRAVTSLSASIDRGLRIVSSESRERDLTRPFDRLETYGHRDWEMPALMLEQMALAIIGGSAAARARHAFLLQGWLRGQYDAALPLAGVVPLAEIEPNETILIPDVTRLSPDDHDVLLAELRTPRRWLVILGADSLTDLRAALPDVEAYVWFLPIPAAS